MNFIQGEKFITLHNNKNVFYCHTENVNQFLISNNFNEEFILISHNGDGKVFSGGNHFPHANAELIPPKMKKWYAQNVNIKHEKIESIPIGLENSRWFAELKKIEKLQQKSLESKKFTNWLYINHNINTNIKERLFPYELLKDQSFVTTKMGQNGFEYENYLNDIHNHKFVLCPEGNGIDTHRTWECLYLNTIPIEKRNINNSFYKDLPICFVDDWNEITLEFLEKEYNRIISNSWNLCKLDFDYWKNKILLEITNE